MGRRRGKVQGQAKLEPKLSGKGIVAQTASLERRRKPHRRGESLRYRTEQTGTLFECPFLFGSNEAKLRWQVRRKDEVRLFASLFIVSLFTKEMS